MYLQLKRILTNISYSHFTFNYILKYKIIHMIKVTAYQQHNSYKSSFNYKLYT